MTLLQIWGKLDYWLTESISVYTLKVIVSKMTTSDSSFNSVRENIVLTEGALLCFCNLFTFC